MTTGRKGLNNLGVYGKLGSEHSRTVSDLRYSALDNEHTRSRVLFALYSRHI